MIDPKPIQIIDATILSAPELRAAVNATPPYCGVVGRTVKGKGYAVVAVPNGDGPLAILDCFEGGDIADARHALDEMLILRRWEDRLPA